MRSGNRGKVWQRALTGASHYAIDSARIFFINLTAVATAVAQPTGGVVVAGQASIASTGATTLVTQSTSKAIINWQDFSLSSGQTVQFAQPGSASITLNRVTGGTASAINGSVLANGQVWILNSNGVLFGQGSTIHVGGLLATTSDIANNDFLSGNYSFSGGGGTIVNNGTIQAAKGGSVVLSAPKVVNNGLIKATAGHVVLAGTDTFTVDFNGDHLLSYAVGASTQTGNVTNAGVIKAAGGQVLMTARAASNVADGVINNSGAIEATSARKGANGEIILDAADGTAQTSGTLNASGKAAGTSGGTVELLGQTVAVADGAKIDVSGDAGGGTALIGGNFHGAGPEQNAVTTTVGQATIKADAVTSGNGGKVAIYSVGTTQVAAKISAKGGVKSGAGGQVETSGHNLAIADSASVNVSSAVGLAGTWLLDPDNIIIDNSGSASVSGQTFSTTGTVTISANTISGTLASGGDVNLQANQNITENAGSPVSVALGSNQTLTLDAGGSVILNDSVIVQGGTVVLKAGDQSASGGALAGAAITMAAGKQINANSVTLNASNGVVGASGAPVIVNAPALSVISDGAAYVSATASSGVVLGTSNVVTNFFLTSSGDVTQSGSLTGENLSVTTTGSAVTITNTSDYGLALSTSGGAATFSTTNALTLSTVNVGSGVLTLAASGGAITQAASATITAGSVDLTTTNNNVITITNAGNTIGTLKVSTDSNAAASVNAGTVQLSVIDVGTGAFTLSSSGIVTQSAAGSITAGQLNLSASGAITLTNGGSPISQLMVSDPGFPVSIDALGDVSLSNVNVGTSSFTFLAGGAVTQANGTAITAAQMTMTGGMGGINLPNTGNTIANLSVTSNGNYSATVATATAVTISGATVPNSIFTLMAGGAVNQSAAINVSRLNLTAGGAVNLTTTGNIIGTLAISTNNFDASVVSNQTTDIGGINLGTGTPGNFTLSVTGGGSVTETAGGIQSQDANISAASAITLGSGNNNIFGTARFTSGGNVSYANGSTAAETILGNSSIGGTLTVNAPFNILVLGDQSGGAVAVTGSATLTSKGVTQSAGFGIPLSASGLTVNSTDNITLSNGSNGIGGTITLQATGANGNVSLFNNANTTLGAVDANGNPVNGTIGISSQGVLALTASVNSSTGVSLQAVNGITQSSNSISAPTISLSGGSGMLGATSQPLSLASSSGTISLSVTGGTGAYLFANSAVVLSGASLSSGAFDLRSVSGAISQSSGTTIAANSVSLESDNGSIGTPGMPMSITGSATVSLSLYTSGNDAFINTNTAVSIDNNGFVGGGAATGVNLNGGNFNLMAGGSVTQTWGIAALSMNVTNTGAGSITLTDAGNFMTGDNGNVISSAARFYTTGNASYVNADSQDPNTIIGSSNVGGNLTVAASNTSIEISDNTGAVAVGGNTMLTAQGGIVQGLFVSGSIDTTTAIPILTQGLKATSGSNIVLNHPANAVMGTVNLFNPSDGGQASSFTNSVNTILGNSSIFGGLTVVVAGPAQTLTLADVASSAVSAGNGPLFLQASGTISQTIPIKASGGLTVNASAVCSQNCPAYDITLGNSANQIGGVIALQANGNVTLANNQDAIFNLITQHDGNTPVNSINIQVTNGGVAFQENAKATNAFTVHASGNIGTTTDGSSGLGTIWGGAVTLTSDTGMIGAPPSAAPNPATPYFNVIANTIFANTANAPIIMDLEPLSASTVTIGGINAGTGSVTLTSSDGTLTSAAGSAGLITAGGLTVQAPIIDLEAGNAVSGAVTLTSGNSIFFGNGLSTILGSLSAQNSITVVSGGNITLPAQSAVTSYYGNITLAAAGNFINNSSATAVDPGGRFLIYSAAPTNDVFGGLNSNNSAIWNTVYPTAISQTGNRYVFAYQPTITVTTGSLSKTYGTDVSASLVNDYTISAQLQPGVAGAFLGDTAASIISGAPAIGSLGAAAGANVTGSPYAITASIGGLTLANGYGVTFVNGALSVNPATLTYVSDAASRIYGAANPSFSGTVTGFVNGDTLASATSGTLSFGAAAVTGSKAGFNPSTGQTVITSTVLQQAATAASGVGTYAIYGSGLSAGNYVFVQAAANTKALTINPATLTYLANAANRSYGQANGVLSGSVTGFVNGDTLTSATTGTLAFTSPATAGSDVGSYAINGAGLTAGNYNFIQATGNATALTINPALLTLALTGTVSKTFDGSNAATLNQSNYTALSGIFGTDNVSLANYPASGTYDSAAIGTGKTVTVSGLSLTGSKAANYIIASTLSGAVGVINAAVTTTTTVLTTTTNVLNATAVAILKGFTAALTATTPATSPVAPPITPPPATLTPVTVALAQAVAQQQQQAANPLSGEPPTSSDQTTGSVAQSLDGGPAPNVGSAAGGVVIPHFLVAHPAAPSAPLTPGALPSWGNAGLWQ